MDLANCALRTSPKFTTGVKYHFHRVFDQIRDPEIPIILRPLTDNIIFKLNLYSIIDTAGLSNGIEPHPQQLQMLKKISNLKLCERFKETKYNVQVKSSLTLDQKYALTNCVTMKHTYISSRYLPVSR